MGSAVHGVVIRVSPEKLYQAPREKGLVLSYAGEYFFV